MCGSVSAIALQDAERVRPLAILATPWIEQNLLLFARTLWRRRQIKPAG